MDSVATDDRAVGESPSVEAAIDVGSNSVHVLVGRVDGHDLQSILDESVFLGLGTAVAATGEIGAERRDELVRVLAGYVARARELGARDVALLGTEPFRRAGDARAVADAVRNATGCALEILDHEDEARLTAIGVTLGRAPGNPRLIVDIGGGSTEFIVVRPGEPPVASGIPLGSARLTDTFVRHDPPLEAEVEELRAAARQALAAAGPADVGDVTAVGGTAGNLVKIVPEARVDGLLTLERLDAALRALIAEPAATFGPRYLLNPRRTPLLPAGIAIVEAILEWAGVERLQALDVGIREGAVVAMGRARERWRELLPELVRGWP